MLRISEQEKQRRLKEWRNPANFETMASFKYPDGEMLKDDEGSLVGEGKDFDKACFQHEGAAGAEGGIMLYPAFDPLAYKNRSQPHIGVLIDVSDSEVKTVLSNSLDAPNAAIRGGQRGDNNPPGSDEEIARLLAMDEMEKLTPHDKPWDAFPNQGLSTIRDSSLEMQKQAMDSFKPTPKAPARMEGEQAYQFEDTQHVFHEYQSKLDEKYAEFRDKKTKEAELDEQNLLTEQDFLEEDSFNFADAEDDDVDEDGADEDQDEDEEEAEE